MPVSTAVPSVGSLSSPTVTIVGGNETGGVQFVANSPGGTTITAGTPSGFSTPATGTSLNVTVQASNITPFTATIGQNLQKVVNLTLSAPVSSATQVTVTSSDPSKLKFSTAPDVAGSPSITLTIPINQSNTADFYAQGFANTGTVGYTVTSSGFGTVNSTVTLAPAGLIYSNARRFWCKLQRAGRR